MCGIAGFWRPSGFGENASIVLRRMADAVRHRGPDDHGQWVDGAAGIGLGHRRLSIIDLSAHGHQPMLSPSGRWVLVLNGEIYNFRELRKAEEEKGARFRGHSDTEVLLAAIDRCGIEKAIRSAAGMFAIAAWDRQTRTLYLVRDRLGEKPLYYGWAGDTFLFGSELKALRANPSWTPTIDRQSLTSYFRFGYVPAPRSIFRDIRKVTPGCIVAVTDDRSLKEQAYWSLGEVVARGLTSPLEGDEHDLIEQVEHALAETVREQMVADVPLGAFLSGGVDSTTLVALMQANNTRAVRTFTIGFPETGFDEAAAARRIAAHLGTDHTEAYVTPDEAMSVIPRLPLLYDEPFGDSSQIPTFLVSAMARNHVTVALSGDGGDEAFGGYNRYSWGRTIWRLMSHWPVSARRLAARAVRGVSPGAWQVLLEAPQRVLPRTRRVARVGEQMHKLSDVLEATSAVDMYGILTSQWRSPSEVVLGASEEPPFDRAVASLPPNLPPVEHMMAVDALTYLPDDILVKVDRASMGVSLETRAPYVDHRVVEIAARIPLEYKLRDGRGKWILRQILYRYVPRDLVEQPKMGFGVPIASWLRGPLKEWAEDLLSADRLRRDGHLDSDTVRSRWLEHGDGRRNWQFQLWSVLMFQMWLDAFPSPSPVS